MNDMKLGDQLNLRQIFLKIPDLALPIIDCFQHLMRGSSSLSPGERELIYSYTSGLDGCHFCAFSHRHCAIGLGIPESVFSVPRDRIGAADLPAETRERLAFASSLHALERDSMSLTAPVLSNHPASAREDVVRVTAFTAFMNRVIDGLGAISPDAMHVIAGKSLAQFGYLQVRKDVESLINATGSHPTQRLDGLPSDWPGITSPLDATMAWLNAVTAQLLRQNSGISTQLRLDIRQAVLGSRKYPDDVNGTQQSRTERDDALLQFAVAVGTSKARSVADDFARLRGQGWTDRDIIDAVLIAAGAACSLRVTAGMDALANLT